MKSLTIGLMTSADEAGVLGLMTQPIGDAWGLAHQFVSGLAAGLALHGAPVHVVVARDELGVVACGFRAVRPVWWGGMPARLGYMGALRQHQRLSPWARLQVLRDSFAVLATTHLKDELPWDLTSILTQNRRALRLLNGGVNGLPRYHFLTNFRTAVLSAHHVTRAVSPGARPALLDDLPGLIRLLAPRPDEQLLQRCEVTSVDDWWVVDGPNGLSGCVQLVDTRNMRDIRVTSIPRWAMHLRSIISGLRTLRGLSGLPIQNESLNLAYVHHLRCVVRGVESRNITRALVTAAAQAATERGLSRLVVGADENTFSERHFGAADVLSAKWYAVGQPLAITGHLDQCLASL